MIVLRNFSDNDAEIFQEKDSTHMSLEEIRAMFLKWNKKGNEVLVYLKKILKQTIEWCENSDGYMRMRI